MTRLLRILPILLLALATMAAQSAAQGVSLNGIQVVDANGNPVTPIKTVVSQPGANVCIDNDLSVGLIVTVKQAGVVKGTLGINANTFLCTPHGLAAGNYEIFMRSAGEPAANDKKVANFNVIVPPA